MSSVRLPIALREAIAEELATVGHGELQRAVADLTTRYREAQFTTPAMRDAPNRAAYLAVRLPATFAALARVFTEIRTRISDAQRTTGDRRRLSLLDLGAGPGTAMWAARETLALDRVTCVERDPALIALGQRLAQADAALTPSAWLLGDIATATEFPAHDAVVLSYTIGELPAHSRAALVERAWRAATQMLIVVEPGTPAGFQRIHEVRAQLLAAGAHPVAPCPHADVCPMYATADWCHFAARLDRTSQHRALKHGELGYEDEKFSYFVAARTAVALPETRILRHPNKHRGHVELLLCRPAKPERKVIGKSQKEIYKRARQAQWGDEFNF